ncbi:MAG: hypothetical protein L6R42_000007 [Xanthoria sp. 1 TBL-2021]|nr:MAG: hypothetical protein L6R42_000007 [Xanthoria sp. 1 TBL-2021]
MGILGPREQQGKTRGGIPENCRSDPTPWAGRSKDIIPESSNGSVLITSRSREAAFELVGNDKDILKVEPMNESHALALFRKKFDGDDNEKEVLQLLQNLDYMPLAISQAAAYIRQRAPRTTVSRYLNDFRRSEKDRASLLNVAVRDRRRDGKALNSILGTWQISFEYIRSNRPSAARLLSLISFFDRQGIPEELITSRCEANDGAVDFEEDIELEQRQELERWKERYIAIIVDAFLPGKYENWKRCQILFRHAELVLEHRPIEKSFLQRWATILSNAAWYAAEQGRYKEAEQMNRRALDSSEKVLGKEHPDTLTSVYYLAYLLQQQQRYHMAKSLYERALPGYRKVFPSHHPTIQACSQHYTSLL